MPDPVRKYLRDIGCAQHIIRGGLEGLVERWEKTVASVEDGYALDIDSYLNDLDGRQLIEETLRLDGIANQSKYEERVRKADERMRKVVRLSSRCLWGAEAAAENRWSAEKNWWYFTKPKSPGRELLEDLDRDRK